MKPLFFTLQSGLEIMVLPDTQAHVDGHPIITQTYSIFKSKHQPDSQFIKTKEAEMLLEPVKDPDYLGSLKFEVPNKLFEYVGIAGAALDTEEVSKVIEHLSHVRSHQHLWKL